MTTIACNREEMAADSQVIFGETVKIPGSREPKVERIGDSLFGMAGDEQECRVFAKWARDGFDEDNKPELDAERFVAIRA
jgi:ATP-dependent protease HslVU (ClpYQ) peptidase subunit